MVHITSLFRFVACYIILDLDSVFLQQVFRQAGKPKRQKAQVSFSFHSCLNCLNTSLSISSLLTLSSFDSPWFKCSGSPSSNCYFIFLKAFQFKVIVVCKSRHINYLPYACIISWLHFSVINSVIDSRTRSLLLPPDGNCASLHFLCLVCQ